MKEDLKQFERARRAQKLDMLVELVGGVGHDFKNMLMVINGYSEMLFEASSSPAQTELLKEIYIAGERASKLTDQLLRFSEPQPFRLRPMDLVDFTEEALPLMRSFLGDNVTVHWENSGEILPVQADPASISEVLLWLVKNARGRMTEGSRLTIAATSRTLDKDYVNLHPESRLGQFACLSVQESGSENSADRLPQVFPPMENDLATVKALVQTHDGWVEVESQPDGGICFLVFLPSCPTELLAVIAPKHATGGKETLLVVEDDPSVRILTTLVLQKAGYRVLEATTAEEALEVWARHRGRPDLLFTDLVMPGEMAGKALADQLVALKPALKVIYSSGYESKIAVELFEFPKAACFLKKPYHPRALLEAVRGALDTPAQT